MGLCDQLLSHLGKYQQQQEKEAPSTSSKEATPAAAAPFEGMKVVKKQENSDGFEGMILGLPHIECGHNKADVLNSSKRARRRPSLRDVYNIICQMPLFIKGIVGV